MTESRLAQWPQRTVTVLNRLLHGTPTCLRSSRDHMHQHGHRMMSNNKNCQEAEQRTKSNKQIKAAKLARRRRRGGVSVGGGWGALARRHHRTYGEDGVAAVAVHVAELLGGGRREVVQREGGRRRGGRGRHHDRFRRPNAAARTPEALALSRSRMSQGQLSCSIWLGQLGKSRSRQRIWRERSAEEEGGRDEGRSRKGNFIRLGEGGRSQRYPFGPL